MCTVDNCFKRVEQLAMVLIPNSIPSIHPAMGTVYFDLFNARVNL